ncbi:uncharacterized protein LOC143628908 [Bidens hawaiensis]|uniref:uncharacterized protein LOC143628908 n=1 Tax=Bidens hawaiensis TaxID=980011 RepID=UPI00404B1280
MIHKHGFKALDRSLKDIFSSKSGKSSDLPFGGKVLKLSKHLRLTTSNESFQVEQTRLFANWLLHIGEVNAGDQNTGEAIIKIPEDLLIKHSIDPISDLIEFVYPSILDNFKRLNFFHEREILAPKNDIVHEINERLLSLFPEMKGNI